VAPSSRERLDSFATTYLQRGGGHYVLAERLRRGSAEARAALARAGRYRQMAGNLEVKEVRIAADERFVVVHNPEAAMRDEQVRGNLLAYLEGQIAGSDAWPRSRRDELVGALRTRPALYRLLRRTKEGKLRLDHAAVAREARLDGKWLLRSSDETLSAADLAAAYKQLYQVERGWRDLKGALCPWSSNHVSLCTTKRVGQRALAFSSAGWRCS
jgi:hypothetical protein